VGSKPTKVRYKTFKTHLAHCGVAHGEPRGLVRHVTSARELTLPYSRAKTGFKPGFKTHKIHTLSTAVSSTIEGLSTLFLNEGLKKKKKKKTHLEHSGVVHNEPRVLVCHVVGLHELPLPSSRTDSPVF
jgi:hypothetical protein